MNNKTRKEIREAVAKLEEVKEILARIYEEEDEKLSNMPESLPWWEKAYDAADALDNAVRDLEDMIDNLKEAIE